MRVRLVPAWMGAALLLSVARTGHATFSIAAVDLETGEVGVAAASCIAPSEVSIVYGPVPGRGVVVAQSFLHAGTLARGVAGVQRGDAPDDVMASLLDPAFDPEARKRQLAVVDLEGRIAVHTGDQALAFASHRTYAWNATRFTVQGNRLTGPPVLDRMAAAFMETYDLVILTRLDDPCSLIQKQKGRMLSAPFVTYCTFSSARRFSARPSGLSLPFLVLSAIGSLSPLPIASRRLASTPRETKYCFTAWARRSDSLWLYASEPIESVCPSMVT